jgi:hypothetical protein
MPDGNEIDDIEEARVDEDSPLPKIDKVKLLNGGFNKNKV